MKVHQLLQGILKVSEKAACLARAVRAEKKLFELLVQEKTGDAKNKAFVQDFKTLTDVLVQEMVTHDLGNKFPSLAGEIHGEEDNTFTNVLGEAVTVCVTDTPADTAQLLARVLDGNSEAASLLAEVVHHDPTTHWDLTDASLDMDIPDGSIGIWIDPIDSTAQYIGGHDEKHESGMYTRGLRSVLVLIGVYNISTGQPVLGVVNQPFSVLDATSWRGGCWWGVCQADTRIHSPLHTSLVAPSITSKLVVISGNETRNVRDVLSSHYNPVVASGGGYKLLCVIRSDVAAFPLSVASCFKWDTCAPHAILRSLGGGVLDLKQSILMYQRHAGWSIEDLAQVVETECQVKYHVPDGEDNESGQKWCNMGGLLAYRDIHTAMELLKQLASS